MNLFLEWSLVTHSKTIIPDLLFSYVHSYFWTLYNSFIYSLIQQVYLLSAYLEHCSGIRVAEENEIDEIFVPLELVSPSSQNTVLNSMGNTKIPLH